VKILVKLGGTLLDSAESRQRLVQEIKEAMATGIQIVVVHGGGKQMTRFLAERGIESRFVNGLRVTTDEVLDAVLKVFAGTVNHELVGAFVAAGISAVGLSGMDASLIEAEPLDPALGHVGKPVRCDARLLNLLCANTYLPVVACVGGDPRGRYYNVNADQMAVACAVAFQAQKVLFLTDVDGVRAAHGEVCPTLTPSECESLISSEVATGGMHAKLNAAVDAVHRGVASVIIAPGSLEGVINLILSGQLIGTTIVSEHLQAP
jgi:acetylglutamate kinase